MNLFGIVVVFITFVLICSMALKTYTKLNLTQKLKDKNINSYIILSTIHISVLTIFTIVMMFNFL